MKQQVRINHQIRSSQLRVVTEDGLNLGLLSIVDALAAAKERDLDLIEVSPHAAPPVAKIMDFGKWQYLENKKQKMTHAKSHVSETKGIQIHIGTSEHDLALKARQASQFLSDGHRVKVSLFLRGRAKYLPAAFLRERLERLLKLVSQEHHLTHGPDKSPRGLSAIIERSQKKNEKQQINIEKDKGHQAGQNHGEKSGH